MDDNFLTIVAPSEGLYKDKGSRFFAFAYPVSSEEDAKEHVDCLRKKYFDARHHCYAYRIGIDGERYRTCDDGEPAHTAGKPILGQLSAYNLTNTLVVVVRYFGGILLGTGGLVQAYRSATADALTHAATITIEVTDTFTLTFNYCDMNRIQTIIKNMNLTCSHQDFNMRCSLQINVRRSQSELLIKRLETIPSCCLTKITT